MRNIRWRIILVVAVLAIALFKLYPTVKWATVTQEEKRELDDRWEIVRAHQADDRDFAYLNEDAQDELIAEREEQAKQGPWTKETPLWGHIPRRPSLVRNIGTGMKMWWYGDRDLVLPLGLDLMGGIRVLLEVDEDQIDAVFEKLMRRIDKFGVREPDIRKSGDRISIELPGAIDKKRVMKIIEDQAFMQWMLVEENEMEKFTPQELQRIYDAGVRELNEEFAEKVDEEGHKIDWEFRHLDESIQEEIPPETILRIFERKNTLTGKIEKVPLLLRSSEEDPQVVRGDELKANKIRADRDPEGRNIIRFAMKKDAAKRFEEMTGEYNQETENAKPQDIGGRRGWRMAILIDDRVISAPHIRSKIVGGAGQITGSFTDAEVNDMVIQLRSGSLPVKPKIIHSELVGPRIGADSIRMGVRAAIVGLMLVIFFMAIYYLKSGAIAIFALCLNILIILAALATLGATLTLPGIAGIILTIGMAVDANVLIFERIREEFTAAKKIRAAISSGYDKAFRTILDANLTTLITALILYKFGTGPIKGFAVTLSFGIVASMFTALFVTRLVFELLMRAKSFDRLKMLQFFSQPNINFVNFAGRAVTISVIVLAIGMFSFAFRFDDMLGIDFSGGTELRMEFEGDVNIGDVRKVVQNDLGIEDAQVRAFDTESGRKNKISIHSKEKMNEDEVAGKLKEKLDVKLVESPSSTSVGPAHAVTMWKKAIIAIVLSLLGIIIYITFRFEFIFGIAAVVALLHDVLITLGVFSGMFLLAPREINLPIIAAVLTIIGYSLNDTIVVFDRIREDLKIMKRLDFKTIINTSINQTLSRTVLTSMTTLLVLLSLLILGGQAVKDFAFAMLIGVIVGTYSSIFIASPILLYFHKRRA